MTRKTKSKQQETYQSYIFQLVDWQPFYSLSISPRKDDDDPYWEYASVDISTSSIFPERFAGTTAHMRFVGDRSFLNPKILEHNKHWKPLCIGELKVRSEGAEFYAAVPFDSLFGIVSILMTERCHFVVLYGPQIRYGKSKCLSFDITATVDLEEY